jgi:uncharacterized membrane protein YphA (DoxX/SURF4 family)
VDIVLWIVQILLALAFGMLGFLKLTQPKEKAAERMAWVEDFSDNQLRLIGVLELLAAVGLILPVATGILPWLTPLAALGLILIMLGAAVVHIRRKENTLIVVNVVLGVLAAVVLVGRWDLLPF